MSYQTISVTRFGPGEHGAGWIPQTLRENVRVLSADRGVACCWAQDGADSGNQPLQDVSSHPDYPLAWPVIVPRSPVSRVLVMQLDATVSGPGVEVALWCAGRQSAWADPTAGPVTLDVPPQRSDVVACVVWRSLRGSTSAVTVSSDQPGQVTTSAGESPHQLIEYDAASGSASVWRPGSTAQVWPEEAVPVSGGAGTIVTIGTMTVRGGAIWWADATTDGLPSPERIEDGAPARASDVRGIGQVSDALYLRPDAPWCGPTLGRGAVAGSVPAPRRQWATAVEPSTAAVAVAACRSATVQRRARVIVGYVAQGPCTLTVTVGGSPVATRALVAGDGGRDRRVAADSGTTYRLLTARAAIHGGLHGPAALDVERMSVETIEIGDVAANSTIEVFAGLFGAGSQGGRAVIVTCTIAQDRDHLTRQAWDLPDPQPLGGIIGQTLARISANAGTLRAGLARVAMSRIPSRPVSAGDTLSAILPAGGQWATLSLRVEVRAEDCTIVVTADDGVALVTSSHAFTALATHVYALAIAPGNVYLVKAEVTVAGPSAAIEYIRAEEEA
jgi:hypothetical protein